MKVIITKLVGQTGFRKPGIEVDVPDTIAERWIKSKWAKKKPAPRKKKKKDVQDTEDTNG